MYGKIIGYGRCGVAMGGSRGGQGVQLLPIDVFLKLKCLYLLNSFPLGENACHAIAWFIHIMRGTVNIESSVR